MGTWKKDEEKQQKFKLSILHVIYDSYNNEDLAKSLFSSRDNVDITTIVSITLDDSSSSTATNRRQLLQASSSSISINFEIGMLTYGAFSATSATKISSTISQSSTITSIASNLGIDASKCIIKNVQVKEAAPKVAISESNKITNNAGSNSTIFVPTTSDDTFDVILIAITSLVGIITVIITYLVVRRYMRRAKKSSAKKVTPKTVKVLEKPISKEASNNNNNNVIPTSHAKNFNPSYAALPSTRALKLLD